MMASLDIVWVDSGYHWLNALTLTWKQQTHHICTKRFVAIDMTNYIAQTIEIVFESISGSIGGFRCLGYAAGVVSRFATSFTSFDCLTQRQKDAGQIGFRPIGSVVRIENDQYYHKSIKTIQHWFGNLLQHTVVEPSFELIRTPFLIR